MKKISTFILLILVWLGSCKSEDPAPPVENCQVISTDNGGFKEGYEYDAVGMVKTIHYVQQDGMLIDISFTRDQNGHLKESEWHYTPPDTNIVIVQRDTYTYEGKKLKEIKTQLADGLLVQTKSFRYDSENRIIEILIDDADPSSGDSKSIFEYNQDGIQILYEVQSGKGDIYFRYLTKPAGTPGKASEIYLTDHGIPYGLTTNFAYGYKDPGVGTKQEAYIADQNGKLQLAYSLTLKTLNSNNRGFTSGIVWADDASGTEYKTHYDFGECK